MEGKWLRILAAACLAALASVGGVQAQSENIEDIQLESFLPAPPQPLLDRSDAVPVGDQLELVRIAPGIKSKRMHVTLRDGATVPKVTASGPSDRLVYSNTLGRVAVNFGENRQLSDDITITSTGRNGTGFTCRLTRIAFQVDGLVNETPGQPDTPYTVNFALYSTCPYAVTAGAERNARIIAGSTGTVQVNDNAPTWIEVEFPTDGIPVFAYTNMWFAAQFSRANAGLISGTPAQVGHSADIFDFPGEGSACQGSLGGFPAAPHGSFNLEIWGDTLSCPDAYVAYKSRRESGSGINAGGTQATDWITDDITLQNSCLARGFTVAVRAPGTYKFELRNNCNAPSLVPQVSQIVGQSSGQEPRVFEYLFANPINMPQTFSFAVNVNNLNAGVIVTGAQPSIGQSSDVFEIAPACSPQDLRVGTDAMNFSLICQGPPPIGACCDMYINECEGGLLDGELCDATANCQPTCSGGFCKIGGVTILVDDEPVACTNNSQCLGGTCTAPCKEVPQTNCSFPPRFSALDPEWAAGKLCANDAVGGFQDPFPNVLCGQAACCYEDTNDIQQCKNVTRDICDQQLPVNQPRYWQPGRFCGAEQFTCPIVACLGRTGKCFTECPHEQGCGDLDCCTDVCLLDDFCCNVEWDCQCQDAAVIVCTDTIPPNDLCAPTQERRNAGANLVAIPADFSDAFEQATALDTSDPPMCCHNGLPLMCQSGDFQYQTCTDNEDCRNGLNPNALCGPRVDKPFASLWYKFVATNTSHQIQTCTSSFQDATDSIIEVFAVGNPNATTDAEACPSLVPIACSDDVGGCGSGGKLSRVCVEGLNIGETYYFLVGGKSFESRGKYRITISSASCTNPPGTVPNDWCNRGTPITGGTPQTPVLVPFNMTGSTLNCPEANCDQPATKDLWYNYTASCTGTATIDTCATGNPSTNLVVYNGCECPGTNEQPIACTTEGPAGCATAQFPVVAGSCYKVRLDNDGTNTPSGQLRLQCDTDCPPVPVTFDPPNNVVDAGVPSDMNNASIQKGIQQIKVLGLPAGLENPGLCFVLDCETNPFGAPNDIVSVVESAGVYTVNLSKPLSPNGVTQLRYLGNAPGDPATRGRFTTHLGNVDGDSFAFADQDISKLVAVLNGLAAEPPFNVAVPWGKYSTDIDRSGDTTALDLLEVINLFNEAGEYPPIVEFKPSAVTCPL